MTVSFEISLRVRRVDPDMIKTNIHIYCFIVIREINLMNKEVEIRLNYSKTKLVNLIENSNNHLEMIQILRVASQLSKTEILQIISEVKDKTKQESKSDPENEFKKRVEYWVSYFKHNAGSFMLAPVKGDWMINGKQLKQDSNWKRSIDTIRIQATNITHDVPMILNPGISRSDY